MPESSDISEVAKSMPHQAEIRKGLTIFKKDPSEGKHFEGDILGFDPKRITGVSKIGNIWKKGVVPFFIQNYLFTKAQLKTIRDAMRHIENSTRIGDKNCVQFAWRTNQSDFVNIRNENGCASYVGRNGGEQDVYLEALCLENGFGSAAHELVHALGFFHEQARPDRDEYVTIIKENILPNMYSNFESYTTGVVDTLGFPYDYNSIMHYPPFAFTKNRLPTIVPKKSGAVIGNRKGLSDIDIEEIRKLYGCQ